MAAAPYGRPAAPPHAVLLLAVVAIFLVVPSYLAEQGGILETVSEINPAMVMLLPLGLVLVIRWLSGSSRNRAFVGAEPSSLHRTGGSPWGVGIVLLIVLLMVWYQSSSEDEAEE